MGTHPATRLAALAVVLATAAMLAACGGDDSTDPAEDTIVGTWNVTSLTAPSMPAWGDAISDDGLVVTFSFSASGGYTLTVANDWPADPWICSGTASCSISGSYSLSGNTLVFDQGTADEVTVSHTLAGNSLTIQFPAGNGITHPYRYVMRRS